MPLTEKKPLSSNAIKLIAIAAMTVDHIAWAVFPGIRRNFSPLLMHIIGRITCPIMCYCIAEGYHYTRNIRKYTAASLCFRADLAFLLHIFLARFHRLAPPLSRSLLRRRAQPDERYVVACVGLVMLRVAESKKITSGAVRVLLILLICLVSFPSDWSCIASLCVMAFGTNRGDLKKQSFWLLFYAALYAVVYFFAIDRVYGLCRWALHSRCRFCGSITGSAAKAPP